MKYEKHAEMRKLCKTPENVHKNVEKRRKNTETTEREQIVSKSKKKKKT